MGNQAAKVSEADLTTVVCVGVTGSGKSTLCNVLAGEQLSEVSEGFMSGTKQPAHFDITRQRVPLRVVDTIGFLNNQPIESQESVWSWWMPVISDSSDGTDHINKFEELTPVSIFGIDVFLFIERYGRFTEETARHFKVFADLVGPGALKHTILVFTHVQSDKLSQALKSVDLPVGLREISDQVRSVIGVECVSEPRKAAATLLQEIRRIVEANSGRRYKSDELVKMQERRKDLVARIEKLKRVDRREALKKQHSELMNGQRTYGKLLHAIEDAEMAERPSGCMEGCRGFRGCSWPHWPWPR